MTDPIAGWVARAEAALGGAADPSVEVVRGARARGLERGVLRAFTTGTMAGVCIAAVVFRASVGGGAFDAISLALRVLALGFSVRAAASIAELVALVRARSIARRYAIAWTQQGAIVRLPSGDVVFRREDVLGIAQSGHWADARESEPMYVVLRPGATPLPFVALPDVFETPVTQLAEQWMRWRGTVAKGVAASPSALPSKLYDEIAAGARPPGVTALAHGSRWLRRGPYLTLLGAVVLGDAFTALPSSARDAVGTVVIAVACAVMLSVPLAWWWLVRRHVIPRRGLAFVATPGELLLRTRRGTLATPWTDVLRVRVRSRTVWTLLDGHHRARSLRIERRGGEPIDYDADFLGAPVDAVATLLEAYRTGAAGSAPTPPLEVAASGTAA